MISCIPLILVVRMIIPTILMAVMYKKSLLIRNGVMGQCKVTRLVPDSSNASCSSSDWHCYWSPTHCTLLVHLFSSTFRYWSLTGTGTATGRTLIVCFFFIFFVFFSVLIPDWYWYCYCYWSPTHCMLLLQLLRILFGTDPWLVLVLVLVPGSLYASCLSFSYSFRYWSLTGTGTATGPRLIISFLFFFFVFFSILIPDWYWYDTGPQLIVRFLFIFFGFNSVLIPDWYCYCYVMLLVHLLHVLFGTDP